VPRGGLNSYMSGCFFGVCAVGLCRRVMCSPIQLPHLDSRSLFFDPTQVVLFVVALTSSCFSRLPALREFVMGSSLGMRDRPRSRGFRPALCNEGTTEHCVVRGSMLSDLLGLG